MRALDEMKDTIAEMRGIVDNMQKRIRSVTPVISFHKPQDVFGWMSNWSAHPVGKFKTAEHALMHAKAEMMGDTESAKKIADAPNPFMAKKLGRQIRPWNETKWIANREDVMFQILKDKLQSNPDLVQKLKSTGVADLVEASASDAIWGAGTVDATNGYEGLNLLGKAWMRVRDSS